MSRIINPLLLDASTGTSLPVRNFARQASSPVDGPSFAQQLASAQAPVAATTTTAKNAPTQLTPPMPDTPDEDSEPDGTASIEPASSWRVDRSATEFNQDDEDFSFDDFVDIINPIHHIPIIGTIYRELTGDTIKPVSRVVGDVAYGALTGNLVIGAVASVISSAYEQHTGDEPLMQVADALFGTSDDEAEGSTLLAQADMPTDTVPASSDKVENVTLASALQVDPPTAQPKTKQPFGGVMDVASSTRAQPAAALAAASNVQGVPLGNTIYTSPSLSAAARTAALQAAKATPTATAVPATKESAMLATSSAISVPGTVPSDDKKLGQVMMQSADTKTSGNQLPPALVHDMMLMALDKYKTAGNLAPSEMTIGGVN